DLISKLKNLPEFMTLCLRDRLCSPYDENDVLELYYLKILCPVKCDQLDKCSNLSCIRLHGPDCSPCEVGADCENGHCSNIDPPERIVSLRKKATTSSVVITSAGSGNNKKKEAKKQYLKPLEQRIIDHEKAPSSILACRSEFCQRLERERVLVVTAETGSGKSTQLP
ncbi:unnamed protein product, partial [Didymodactylos carnosus]